MAYQPYVPASGPGPQSAQVSLAAKNYKTLAKQRQQRQAAAPRPVAPRPTAPVDPLGQTPQTDIWSQIGRLTGMYGTPQSDAQIQTSAQGQLDPIVAAITANINRRAGQASSAITGNAGALAQSLGQIDYASPYTGAKSEQAAVDEALRSGLAGQGGTLSADLQNRLGVINDPTVQAAGGAVSSLGNSAGNTELASGSANLGSLIAQAAAAKSYGLKQPGIAWLAGLQDVAGVEQGAVNAIGDQTGQVLQLLPNLVQSMRSQNQSLRGDKAAAASNLFSTLTGQNVTKATAKAGLAGDAAQLDYNYANSAADAASAAANTAERTRHDQALEKTAATRAKTAAKKATAGKPLSPSDKRQALKAADLYFFGQHPVLAKDGVTVTKEGVPGIDYGQAIKQLVAGYGLTRQQAAQLANTYYKVPGERGRPYASKQQKFAKTRSQKPKTGATMKRADGTYVFDGSTWVKQ